MKKECFWSDAEYQPGQPLGEDITTSYLIIGGGVSGLFVAHYLLQKGVTDIVLIEKNTIGSGSTGHSAGMLVGDIETSSWSNLTHHYGIDLASLYADAQKRAQHDIIQLIQSENIECEFSTNDVLLTGGNSDAEQRLIKEFHLRERLGMNPKLLAGDGLRSEFNLASFTMGECVEKGISVNPLKFAHGAATYLRSKGVRIYENTPCLETHENSARTPGGSITFSKSIRAQGTAEVSTVLENYITTIAVTRPLSDTEIRELGLLDKDMFIDDEKRSFHYGKVTEDNRLLVGYGDIKTDEKETVAPLHEPHIENIKRFLSRTVGEGVSIEYAWSAAYSLSTKLIPYVTFNTNGAVLGGAGTQVASVAVASYVASVMEGEEHPLQKLFEHAHTT